MTKNIIFIEKIINGYLYTFNEETIFFKDKKKVVKELEGDIE